MLTCREWPLAIFLVLGILCQHPSGYVLYLDNGCPRPDSIEHGNFLLRHNDDLVEYICDPGYMLLGEKIAMCDKKIWSSGEPKCVASGCRQLYALDNGFLEIGYGGAVARFRCDYGYHLEGPTTLICDGRAWNGTQPKCVDESKPKYKFYQHKTNKGDGRFHGHKLSHDEWLMEADYSCITQYGSIFPPKVMHAIPATKWAMVENKPRLYTTYRCKWGYEAVGKSTNLYCQKDEWIGQKPKCLPRIETTTPYYYGFQRDEPIPGVGSSHEEWLRYSDYSCFTKSGEVTAPDIAYGHVVPRHVTIEGKPHLYVQYQCDTGYTVSYGEGYMYCRDRTWIGDVPSCVRGDSQDVGCGTNNGGCSHICSSTGASYKCSCLTGYELDRDLHTCIDIDECATGSSRCHHKCLNTRGSYQCLCDHGYVLDTDGHNCIMDHGQHREIPPLVLFHDKDVYHK